jgi:hypothetical protein
LEGHITRKFTLKNQKKSMDKKLDTPSTTGTRRSQVVHVYYQLFDSKMADGDQLWSVPKLEYDLLRRNASTNGQKTDLIERYILHRKPKQTIFEYLIKRKGV